MIDRAQLSLGILAGGRAQRLGGVDKAWVRFEGQPLVERIIEALSPQVDAILVSSNRDSTRFGHLPVGVVADRFAGHPGPLAGIDALLSACTTTWLIVVPVDLRCIPPDLVARLCEAADGNGAVVEDAEGLQPLVAILRVDTTRPEVADALARGDLAVHRLFDRLGLTVVTAPDLRFGNLNTPTDFGDASIE